MFWLYSLATVFLLLLLLGSTLWSLMDMPWPPMTLVFLLERHRRLRELDWLFWSAIDELYWLSKLKNVPDFFNFALLLVVYGACLIGYSVNLMFLVRLLVTLRCWICSWRRSAEKGPFLAVSSFSSSSIGVWKPGFLRQSLWTLEAISGSFRSL